MTTPGGNTLGARRKLLACADALIDQAYGDPALTLAGVAAELGVSTRQLQRVFAEVGDTTFGGRLEEVRMRRARELLATGDYPSRRIAEHVGYRDGAAFAKAFRRYHGCAPYQFRQDHGIS